MLRIQDSESDSREYVSRDDSKLVVHDLLFTSVYEIPFFCLNIQGRVDPKRLLELDPNGKLLELDRVLAETREANRLIDSLSDYLSISRS